MKLLKPLVLASQSPRRQEILTLSGLSFTVHPAEGEWAPEDLPNLRGLRVLRPGLELGTVKKDRFEPAHALALWLDSCARVQDLEPDSAQMKAYLHGDVIPSAVKGWCLVKCGGYSIGWGKGDGNVLKNHYPKGLRR